MDTIDLNLSFSDTRSWSESVAADVEEVVEEEQEMVPPKEGAPSDLLFPAACQFVFVLDDLPLDWSTIRQSSDNSPVLVAEERDGQEEEEFRWSWFRGRN